MVRIVVEEDKFLRMLPVIFDPATPRLAIVQKFGALVPSIDVEACARRGVAVAARQNALADVEEMCLKLWRGILERT